MSRRPLLSEGERQAVPGILAALGLSDEKLSWAGLKKLCDRFYSMPHEGRSDSYEVAARLELIQRLARAVSRAESKKTIEGDINLKGTLRSTVRELQVLSGD